MKYCANCKHCKQTVIKGGDRDRAVRGRFYRAVFCEKGIVSGPWNGLIMRSLGMVHKLMMESCPYYESMGEYNSVADILGKRYIRHEDVVGGLEWYYEQEEKLFPDYFLDNRRGRKVYQDIVIKPPPPQRATVKHNIAEHYLINEFTFYDNLESVYLYLNMLEGAGRTWSTV